MADKKYEKLIAKSRKHFKKYKEQQRKLLTERYHYYKEQYEKARIKAEKKGYALVDVKLDKKTFKEIYKQYYHEAEKEVAEGKKNAIGNIIKKMVAKQSYMVSPNQARAITRAAKKKGFYATNYEDVLYEGTDAVPQEFWDDISDEYKRLKASGMNPQDIKYYISTEYFGSP